MTDETYPYKEICDALSSESDEKALGLVRVHGWGSGSQSVLMWLGARTDISDEWSQVIQELPAEIDFSNHPYFWGLTCAAGGDQRESWLTAALSLMTVTQITDPMVMQAAANTGQGADLGLIDARATELGVTVPWAARKYLCLAGALRGGNGDVVAALLDRVGDVDSQMLESTLKAAGQKPAKNRRKDVGAQMELYLTVVDQKVLRQAAGQRAGGVNRLM